MESPHERSGHLEYPASHSVPLVGDVTAGICSSSFLNVQCATRGGCAPAGSVRRCMGSWGCAHVGQRATACIICAAEVGAIDAVMNSPTGPVEVQDASAHSRISRAPSDGRLQERVRYNSWKNHAR